MSKLWPIAVFSVFDLALASFLAYLDQRPDKFFMFFMALAVLWVLPALVGIWNLIKFWICYPIFIKRRLVRVYKSQLHQAKFPSSRGHFDHMVYLSSVLDDEEVTQDTKAKAAFILGEMSFYKSERPFTMGLAVQHAFEQAMEEYEVGRWHNLVI
ncbi:hypothetical protein [Agrobacterium salinitolerans]|uniref:hypothetical protein n=1 Tax=Agrobacterium salinitolerans TaxID=1183413 RepID=UPI0022B80967|nr:hypothetical protein [Agrobacterium salinitolerans]